MWDSSEQGWGTLTPPNLQLCISVPKLWAFLCAMRKCKSRSQVCSLFLHPLSIYFAPHCPHTHTNTEDFFLFLKLNQSKQQNQASSLSTHKFLRTHFRSLSNCLAVHFAQLISIRVFQKSCSQFSLKATPLSDCIFSTQFMINGSKM